MSSSPLPGQLTPEMVKAIQQLERKKDYNKQYYQHKTKPKIEADKSELTLLRERCALLEQQTRTQDEYLQLAERYNDLLRQYDRLKEENAAVKQALDVARQRNYELMMLKKDEILSVAQNRTLH